VFKKPATPPEDNINQTKKINKPLISFQASTSKEGEAKRQLLDD